MKMQELKDQSNEQLEFILMDLEKEIFQLKNKLKMEKKLEKPHLLREKKKVKARILTLLTQRSKDNGKK